MILEKGSYNPSLLRHQNRVLMSFRHHSHADWRTEIAIAELDGDWKPIAAKPFLPPDEYRNYSWEDTRLFHYQGKLHASFTISQYPAVEFRAVVAYGELSETDARWTIPKLFIPRHGKNDFTACEKNFVFFEREEKLWCLYVTHGDRQTILEVDGATVRGTLTAKALPCPWGASIHGGAISEGENGTLLHFFNTRRNDIYRIGCAELDGLAPFDMLRICSRPVFVGQEGVNLAKTTHYKANVVFVCGAIKQDETVFGRRLSTWKIAYGINDHLCAIATLRKNHLHLP